MRDDLVGYLLGALEPAEHEAVEAQLAVDSQLRHDFELVSRAIRPLAADKQGYEPPPGLAERTCIFVATQARVSLAPEPAHEGSRWRMADLAVAAGIFLAATLLFFPAVNQSRFAARVSTCQNNLRRIGVAASEYSLRFGDHFPMLLADDGGPADAGAVAARLVEGGYLSSPVVLICPASELAERLSTTQQPPWPQDIRQQLLHARGQRLRDLQRLVAGSYAYNLGYVVDGQYRASRNLSRPTFALVADAPPSGLTDRSANHDRRGQNVLFEDGHVQYLTTCKARGCMDHIYRNDNGQQAPGLHAHDAVLGPGGLLLQLRPNVRVDVVPE